MTPAGTHLPVVLDTPVGSDISRIEQPVTAHLARAVIVGGERYPIRTSAVGRTAPRTRKNDAVKIGAPAAGGALIGALVGGTKGAFIGGAAGDGAGTAVVLSTRGKEGI
jgi:hypothetical protein